MEQNSRRDFLRTAAVAAPAVGVIAAGASTASAQLTPAVKTVVPGPDGAAFSSATMFGPMVFVAGQVGVKPGTSGIVPGTFEDECKQTLENVKTAIEAGKTKMSEVMHCTCFLTDVADFPMFNKVFKQFFPFNPPARSTVVVKELVVPGAKIEVDAIAVLKFN